MNNGWLPIRKPGGKKAEESRNQSAKGENLSMKNSISNKASLQIWVWNNDISIIITKKSNKQIHCKQTCPIRYNKGSSSVG